MKKRKHNFEHWDPLGLITIMIIIIYHTSKWQVISILPKVEKWLLNKPIPYTPKK